MLTHEPFHTTTSQLQAEQGAEQNSGLQILCLEVERQLNRHYKRVLGFFTRVFADKCDYPLSSEQALVLFCISNGVSDIAQLCQAMEPVTTQSVIILAGLYAHGYVSSTQPSETQLDLTAKGQAITNHLRELYDYVFLADASAQMPDTMRLAAMHISLNRLQNYNRSQQIYA